MRGGRPYLYLDHFFVHMRFVSKRVDLDAQLGLPAPLNIDFVLRFIASLLLKKGTKRRRKQNGPIFFD
jgi:hypothetical protein